MWFVVSVADDECVEDVLADIEAETGQQTYNLPKLREFRVEAKFLVDGPVSDGDVDLAPRTDAHTDRPRHHHARRARPRARGTGRSPNRGDAVRCGRRRDRSGDRLGRRDAPAVQRGGKVRRVGVIPNHYSLGYTENGMTVWDVPDDLVSEVGPAVAGLDFVTHCYERPRHDGVWPYNFFAMTHGRTEEESQERIEQVRDVMEQYWDVGDDDWDTLFSTRILKKTGIRLAERADANTA